MMIGQIRADTWGSGCTIATASRQNQADTRSRNNDLTAANREFKLFCADGDTRRRPSSLGDH
jgi:hypothetical protein